MSKLNFPPVDDLDSLPSDGEIWTAETGQQWIYRAEVPGWVALAPTGNSNIVYRGGLNLTQDPLTQYDPISSGNQFIVTVGSDSVDGALYPGLTDKNVPEGSIVMYDGNNWQNTTGIPIASETAKGIVELADASEAVDTSNNLTVLTPERGANLVDSMIQQASTTVVGKTRYATQVETTNGIEAEAAITPASLKQMIDDLKNQIANSTPTGMISWFTSATETDIPAGWMYCDGRVIYNTEPTANLYAKLKSWGNPWGPSPESDTVKLPDLRGRFIRGFNDGTNRDPSDTAFGVAVDDQFQSHTHGINDPGHDHTIKGRKMSGQIASVDHIMIDNNIAINAVETTSTFKETTKISIKSTGAAETVVKNLSLLPVIKL